MKWKRIGGWVVYPIPVKHTNNDETDCENYAYIVRRGGEILLYMTDWKDCHYRLQNIDINHFLIGINYSEIPEGENRNHVLFGHASLDTVRDFLIANMTEHTRAIIACHLSQQNADEETVYRTLLEIAPDGCLVEIAEKGKVIEIE